MRQNLGLFSKSKGLSDELPRYALVIIISFLADFGILFLFKKTLNLNLTVSVLGSYAVGVYVNYVLSSHWVFGTRRFKNDYREPLYFWLIAAGGAVLSLLAIRALDSVGLGLALSKILAEGSVAVLSFGGKKVLLFSDFEAYKRVWLMYKSAAFGDRLHVLIRYVTVPYKRIKKHVPDAATTLLEIGTGHGLIAHLLAADCMLTRVVGVDIDADKITAAKKVSGDVHFMTVIPKHERYDVVLIADVLYLLDTDAKEAMINQALESCKPGGTVLIKEMSHTPRWKFLINQLQETISVKLLKITDFNNRPTLVLANLEAIATILRTEGYSCTVKRLDQGYLHPHCLLIITKATA